MHFRNNVYLSSGVTPSIFVLTSPANTNSADYDGFMPAPGNADQFGWNTPDTSKRY